MGWTPLNNRIPITYFATSCHIRRKYPDPRSFDPKLVLPNVLWRLHMILPWCKRSGLVQRVSYCKSLVCWYLPSNNHGSRQTGLGIERCPWGSRVSFNKRINLSPLATVESNTLEAKVSSFAIVCHPFPGFVGKIGKKSPGDIRAF